MIHGADPRISACLIVKNEQPFLDGCLLSLRDLVDEVVIVDTGSTDASIDIARSHGARVIKWAWRNDFAAARNVGLDAAGSEWLLYIDADERLVTPSREALRQGLAAPDVFAANMKFRVRSNATLYREFRLFRNDARLRFKGAIHETIRPDLKLLVDAGGRTVDTDATLVHLGYDGDMTHKYRRNLPLLREAIRCDPDRIYYWNDLAQSLHGLGQIDGALEITGQGLARAYQTDSSGRAMHSLLCHTHACLLLERGGDPDAVIAEGLACYPANWSLRFLRARRALDSGAYDVALAELSQLLAQDATSLCDDNVSFDQRIFGCYAHDLTGVALLRQGDRHGAAAAFARAAAAAPDTMEYRVKAMALGAMPA